MTTVAPGWYADPWGSDRQRWWDGVQWTEHVQPAPQAQGFPQPLSVQPTPAAAPLPATPARRKSRRGLLFGLLGAVAAIALVVTVGVVAVNGLVGVDRTVAVPTASQPVTDRDYAMTKPLLGISSKSELTFPADFDVRKYKDRQIDAFELYLDSSLTERTSLFIAQDSPGSLLRMRPTESTSQLRVDAATHVRVMSDSARQYESWGLEPEYYLVRHIDGRGQKLDVPVVTKITTEAPAIAAPTVRLETRPAVGGLTIAWTPVEGATEFIVISSSNRRSEGSDGRSYRVVGTTAETTWASTQDGAGYAEKQNSNLTLFSGSSADNLANPGSSSFATEDTEEKDEVNGYRWGVIASNGRDRSQIGTADFTADVAALPYKVAEGSMREQGTARLNDLPTSFAFTGLDGLTRSTQAFIPEDGIVRNDSTELKVTVRGVGTRLEWRTTWYDLEGSIEPTAFRTDYNARAAAAAPTTGGTTLLTKSLEQATIDGKNKKPVSAAAVTSYPVYGSDEYVRFIAGHLIVGTKYIDVTKFADAPGAQSVWMALKEAVDQNPYVFGVRQSSQASAGDKTVLVIRYDLEPAERERLQASIASAVADVIASVVHEGMSDRDKAVVLNDWVTANTEYDYEAFEKIIGGGELKGFEYAWDASGSFERGKAVCAGYSKTYDALMNAAGVPTVYVTGQVYSSGMRHAWNKVKIDGAWYAVDTTWNDTPAGNDFLLIRDSEFTGSAARAEDPDWIRPDLVPSYATP